MINFLAIFESNLYLSRNRLSIQVQRVGIDFLSDYLVSQDNLKFCIPRYSKKLGHKSSRPFSKQKWTFIQVYQLNVDIWAKGLESPNRAHKIFELTREEDIQEIEPEEYNFLQKSPCVSTLSKYGSQKGKVVGFGASGCVSLLISNTPTGEITYAVKEFKRKPKKESKKDYVKRLTSEFCISSCLHHEHVVETIDLVVDSKKHWCEGMSLLFQ
jgi:hypothetical protein